MPHNRHLPVALALSAATVAFACDRELPAEPPADAGEPIATPAASSMLPPGVADMLTDPMLRDLAARMGDRAAAAPLGTALDYLAGHARADDAAATVGGLARVRVALGRYSPLGQATPDDRVAIEVIELVLTLAEKRLTDTTTDPIAGSDAAPIR